MEGEACNFASPYEQDVNANCVYVVVGAVMLVTGGNPFPDALVALQG